MRTFQSRHSRWGRYNNPANFARRNAARDAERIKGHTVIVRLMRDRHHRSGQWAAEIDGETVASAAGLTALWDLLHKRWPKAMSRRQTATWRHDPT